MTQSELDPTRPFDDDEVWTEPETEVQPEPALKPSGSATIVSTAGLEVDEFDRMWSLASTLSKTDFVPKGYAGKPGAILGCVMLGRELGIGPMASLQHIYVSKSGRPSLSAEIQLALVRKAGHKVEGTSDAARAEVTGVRGDTSETITVVWTIETAAAAGLVTVGEDGQLWKRSQKGEPLPWELYPAQMLWARAVTQLVRMLFPDVVTLGGDE